MTVNDIYNYVLLTEQRLETKIKSHSKYWLIGAGVAIILIIVLLFIVFKSKGKVDETYKDDIRALDSTIKYQQKYIDALQANNEQQDSVIAHLNEAYKKNRPTETRIIHSYEQIPNSVHSLSNDSLRRAVTDFE